LIGNDENCIQGPLFDATVSEMAANKIEKLLMIETIDNLTILLAAILKMMALSK
jgi:hypothetical protein